MKKIRCSANYNNKTESEVSIKQQKSNNKWYITITQTWYQQVIPSTMFYSQNCRFSPPCSTSMRNICLKRCKALFPSRSTAESPKSEKLTALSTSSNLLIPTMKLMNPCSTILNFRKHLIQTLMSTTKKSNRQIMTPKSSTFHTIRS